MKNIAASVRAHLLSHARSSGSDLLSFGDSSVEGLRQVFAELLAARSEPEDGLIWGHVEASRIREDQRYQGVRIMVKATLAGAVVPVQVDIGFGDAITPAPVSLVWHELLDFPEARLLTYPPETVIAEKLDAAVQLELDNSRMKDFFDLDWLCRNMEFEHATLRAAIVATFDRRGTMLPDEAPLALTEEFANDKTKITQWKAFLRKNRLEADELPVVITRLHDFLMPILLPLAAASKTWKPERGWS
ncbi:MAG: nucleotidyl transferase AbiEii/AbiGii toxin family protein [Prosthecobacter sp.]|uniref:nucleotidyl transferase AbiEii/AbiGii toxin family protein n=1 Tax=Prosthecobacter sp. TaxID=1965333 RepID=UPI0039044181